MNSANLSPDEVRRALGPAAYPTPAPARRYDWNLKTGYLEGDEQRRVKSRVHDCQALIIGMSLRHVSVAKIGVAIGVSDECIAKRLRPLGLTPGVVGRPSQSIVGQWQPVTPIQLLA